MTRSLSPRTKGSLKAEFFAYKLKIVATNYPDSWFTKMELIRAKLKLDCGYEIDDEDYMEHILEAFQLNMMPL